MNKKLLKTLAVSIALISASASAEIVVGDWKNQGDNLILLDTNTGAEWLNPSYTKTYSIDNLSSELEAGGLFEGFRVLNSADVESFILNFYSGAGDFLEVYKEEYNSSTYQLSEKGYQAIETDAYARTQEFFNLIDPDSVTYKPTSTSSKYSNRNFNLTYINENYDGDTELYKTSSVSISLVQTNENGTPGKNDGTGVLVNSSNFISSYPGSGVIVDGYETYSSLNNEEYNLLKVAGLNAVSATDVSAPNAPLPAILALGALIVGFRKKFI